MRIIKIVIAVISIVFMASCSHSIDPNDIFQSEKRIILSFPNQDKITSNSIRIVPIEKDSEKYKRLKIWLTNHNSGWKTSIASYSPPDMLLINDDFRLLIFPKGVVIGFTNN